MSDIPRSTVADQLRAVLEEALHGPEGDWAYFSDPGSDGLMGTLRSLSGSTASHSSGPGGTTIAAHAHHLSFALEFAAAWIRGDREPRCWDESWRVGTVDEEEWAELRAKLRRRSQEFMQVVETADLSSDEALGGAMGTLAHLTYHLGAIRQKVATGEIDPGEAGR